MEEVFIEQVVMYGAAILLCAVVVYFYLRQNKVTSSVTRHKVAIAKAEGLFEPVSLHPYIDLNTCIGSAACISDCPEKDILGLIDGKATVINASNCVGHGACFHACPVEAISLRIGTEARGVDLPHVNENFETNVSGIYIAGELGGMGLIKNSVEQGQQAVEYMVKRKKKAGQDALDIVIIGAGPAGISASLAAKKHGLTSITLEQDSLGGTVYTFPRAKVVMTSPMNLPLFGKVKLTDTSKDELLGIWKKVISENSLRIKENTKVKDILPMQNGAFKVVTAGGDQYISNNVLLAIGRRGSPRKLGIKGEDLPKVAYRLIESERISNKKIIVVGGGDSAVESALLLKDRNEVILSYRKDKFSRLKPKNKHNVERAVADHSLKMMFNSDLVSVDSKSVSMNVDGENKVLENDLVYIFAGGEMPTEFLQKAGIEISKRFGHIVKKHG
ncbi:MAG: NAD(P)-binding domain-containing protein [Cyclobacteriaceae bacterium]|nr:NAD(P)-binding domain-containing protein [Cyclobacteriaceae bacterium]MDH4298137.1 NAD(P)-binding domain-containing protein [Cyclobacteriaceae bacterium]MDH5250836.1 NAD(P)-binding domain-containing protein [Cyclobacteriaceae bacterium]